MATPPALAVAVSADFPDMRPDWPLLRQALADRGVAASTRVWTDPGVPWSEFDLVVANGAWVATVAETTPLVNLAALSGAGVATVPTTWLAPGRALDQGEPDLSDLGLPPGTGEFVVKPTISGGGFETARYRVGDAQGTQAARAHIMVQPYQAAVDAHGEAGLVFLGGRYSHAIGKGPLLRVAAGPQSRLWEHEEIGALLPSEAQLEAAHRALAAAEQLVGPSTYARVDLVGTVLDPALFFETQPSAATRFAQVLRDCIP